MREDHLFRELQIVNSCWYVSGDTGKQRYSLGSYGFPLSCFENIQWDFESHKTIKSISYFVFGQNTVCEIKDRLF